MKRSIEIPSIETGMAGIFFRAGSNPVFGRLTPSTLGLDPPPTNFASPKLPTLQSLLAATRTQIDWFAGRPLMMVENPVTSDEYNHFPFSKP